MRKVAFSFLVILVGLGLAAGGCRPRLVLPGDSPKALTQAIASLHWTLEVDPAGSGVYRLGLQNPGQSEVSLAGLVSYLEAEVGRPDAYPKGPSLALPAGVEAGGAAWVSLSLPTESGWPDTFVIAVMVGPGGGAFAAQEVTQGTFAPGKIAFTPIWPDAGYTDFPSQDYLLLGFKPAVGAQSLAESLSFEPAVVFECRPDTNQDPGVLEVHFPEGLAPFTRYTASIRPELRAADGQTILGRPRSLVFSTGASGGDWFSTPVWAPDGTSLAWVAPGSVGLSLFLGDVATMAKKVIVSQVAGTAPAYSPDGRFLYYGGLSAGQADLGRLDLTTNQPMISVTNAALGGPCSLSVLVSPSGRYLGIEADYGGVDSHSDIMKSIFIYDLQTATLTRLPGHGLTARLVGWAGERLLYAGTFQHYDDSHLFRYNLYRYDPVGGSETCLLSGGELENVGGFTLTSRGADAGGAIGAYWSWETQNLGVTIVHRPAGLWMAWGLDEAAVPSPARLTGEGRYRDVALSPDATLVAAAKVTEGSWDIVVVDTGDATERNVADGPSAQFGPSWSADGSRLAYFEVQGSLWFLIVLDPVTDEALAFQG
jgi:hypothetical protein